MENENEKEVVASADTAKSDFEVLAAELKALTDAVKSAQKTSDPSGEFRSEDKEKIEKMEAEVASMRKTLDHSAGLARRRAEFDLNEDSTQTRAIGPDQVKSILSMPTTQDSAFSEIQRANDDLYIGMVTLGIDNPWKSPALKNYLQGLYPNAYKAMETSTSTAGGDFIPTGFSRNLIELVQLDLRVAALHGRFNMPTNPYTFPVEGADMTAYVVGENTGDNDAGTTATWVPASTPGTANNTFTAKKVGVRSVLSQEINEDSIISVIPYVRGKIARSLAQAQENTVINGDVRTSSNIDGVTLTSVQTTAYDGYRRAAQLAGTTYDLSTFDLATLRTLRAGMGVYGVDTQQLCYVTGINGYHKLLGLTEVITMDKIGNRATILSGQMGELDGIPIVLSEYLVNTYDSQGLNRGTDTKTEVILTRKDMFQFGDWRDITLKNREVIETDQFVLVALQRLAFKSLFTASGTQTFCAAGVNVTP